MLGRRRWVMAIVALGASALGLTACSTPKDAPQKETAGKDPSVPAASVEPWKVGSYLSLSGAETQFGSIAPGRRADLVLLDADPLRDIRNTTRISAVMIGGRVLERSELDASIDRARRLLNP